MNQADAIRQFVDAQYIKPARANGTKQFDCPCRRRPRRDEAEGPHASDLASALGAKLFETTYGVKCVGRTGPHNGANLTFTFDL